MVAGDLNRGSRPRTRYRRRRPLPALVLFAVLGVMAAFVWFRVIENDGGEADRIACGPPPAAVPVEGQAPQTPGQPLPKDSLDRSTPAPAAEALVRVVNASGQNRKAGAVTETLRDLGFTQITDPANDTLYPNGSLPCRAQIRFGPQGEGAARTLSLVEPCAELVRDERPDATIDLAVGQRFDDLKPRPEARKALEQLTEWARTAPPDQGGLAEDGSAVPPVDAGLMATARAVRCT